MQRDREVGSIFGGKDPFNDPFFSRPNGNSFGSETFRSNDLQQPRQSEGPVIEEIDSDAEEEARDAAAAWSNRNPLVEHPEDQTNHEKSTKIEREISHTSNSNIARSVSFQRVTYGGINGAYYSATTSRRTGSDGITMEESNEADRTTGQATQRVSRGIHDKGHSVTRKLESDGKVNTVQTLHNLDEGELAGFEQAWGANADVRFQPFSFPANFGTTDGRFGPLASWEELSQRSRGPGLRQGMLAESGRRPKNVVRINIE